MIWFIWLIWILISFGFLYFGFSGNKYIFKLLGGTFILLAGIVVFYQGISYENGFVESYYYQCTPTCFENRSLSYNITEPMVQSVVKTNSYALLDTSDRIGLGLAVSLFFVGIAIILQSSLDEIKRRKEKRKKGSLEYSGEE